MDDCWDCCLENVPAPLSEASARNVPDLSQRDLFFIIKSKQKKKKKFRLSVIQKDEPEDEDWNLSS